MYGMGDAIRGYQEDIIELKEELREKEIYISSLEHVCSSILDWYWNIDEPGLVPDSRELRGNLMFINKILKNYKGNVGRIREKIDGKGR